MPRKKQQSTEVLDVMPVEILSEVQSSPSEKSTVNRISIPLASDGSIDYSSMRESTREKLKSAIGSSAGFTPSVDAPSIIEINMDFIPYMYGMMTMGIQLGGKKAFGWPDELAKHIRFNDDELEALKEPTAKVIKKYSSKLTFWLKHQEEFALLQVLLVSSKTMVERAAMIYIQEVRATQQQPVQYAEPLPGDPVASA